MNQEIDTLISQVRKQTKESYKTVYNSKNKPVKSIANFGLKKDQVATKRDSGEYAGMSIRATEDIPPIISDRRFIKTLKLLKTENIQGAISVLNISKFITKHGIAALYYTLHYWIENCTTITNIPTFISNEYKEISDEELDDFIEISYYDPVQGSFTIHSVGQSTSGVSAVPIEWLNREFPNATILHEEMDKLDWRIGKPPVYYAIIYSIKIVDDKQVSYEEFTKRTVPTNAIFMYVSDTCSIHNSRKDLENKINQLKNSPTLASHLVMLHENLIIFINPNTFNKYEKKDKIKSNEHYERVGFLVSCLQKCIRRGTKNSQLLWDTVFKLNQAPPYNLPEQQFIRVSGAKQLVWRLFISTIEDSDVYITNSLDLCNLLDLICYTLVCHLDTDLQFTNNMINKIVLTAINIQNITTQWPWRNSLEDDKYDKKLGFTKDTSVLDAFKLALTFMPMMQGDNALLTMSINYADAKLKQIKNKNITYNFKTLTPISSKKLLEQADEKVARETFVISNDMHCTPNLLIYSQASLNYIPTENETTKELSHFIWDTSSSINIRETKKRPPLTHLNKIIYYCQSNMYNVYVPNKPLSIHTNYEKFKTSKFDSPELPGISRLAFLLIFGQEITLPGGITITFSDDVNKPFKFKKKSDTKFIHDEKLIKKYTDLLLKTTTTPIKKILDKLPGGYSWAINTNNRNEVTVSVKRDVNKKNQEKFIFSVNGIETEAFNGSKFITKNSPITLLDLDYIICDPPLKKLVSDSVYLTDNYGVEGWTLLNILYARGNELREICRTGKQQVPVFSWHELAHKVPIKVWQNIYVRMLSTDGTVNVYQVDRGGNKLLGACDYMYEGCVLRMLLLLSLLYPLVIQPKTNSLMSYVIDSSRPEYVVMINTIKTLMTPAKIMATAMQTKTLIDSGNVEPKVITRLWDHQILTSNSIYDGLVNKGKKGYGDAASVGSGKTLTTINTMTKLLPKSNNHQGFLVLVPNMRLIETWIVEIKKHTTGFRVITQTSNGSWDINGKIVANNKCEITRNTIAITTLGRMRDKPKDNSWILVIIDECLSVQNSGALQTESAFRQIMLAQFGVIMLSATFFRARFDKLYFMLKMLQSGYPENRSYLSTIINEHVFCHVSESTRKWITTTNKFQLSPSVRKRYEDIRTGKLSVEKKYQELLSIVLTEFDIKNAINDLLNKANNENRRCLIYARSKSEADSISKLAGVTRYPDKKGNHIVVSYQEGTFGLNDLTDYDSIITRMNHLDIVIQQKGRLDRPGQTKTTLYLDFILVENTVDEAWKLKFEMTNGFYTNYLLPLSEFYKLAIEQK